MAEIAIRTTDRPMSGNPRVDRHRSVRGCVLDIRPDGWQWGPMELNSPDWRIVKLPGLDATLLTQFINSDLNYGNPEAEALNPVLRRWMVKVNMDQLDQILAHPQLRKKLENAQEALQTMMDLKTDLPVLEDTAGPG
jgi:hypothetical protein